MRIEVELELERDTGNVWVRATVERDTSHPGRPCREPDCCGDERIVSVKDSDGDSVDTTPAEDDRIFDLAEEAFYDIF